MCPTPQCVTRSMLCVGGSTGVASALAALDRWRGDLAKELKCKCTNRNACAHGRLYLSDQYASLATPTDIDRSQL